MGAGRDVEKAGLDKEQPLSPPVYEEKSGAPMGLVVEAPTGPLPGQTQAPVLAQCSANKCKVMIV